MSANESRHQRQFENSAIVDLADEDDSDYELDGSKSGSTNKVCSSMYRTQLRRRNLDNEPDLKGQLTAGVATYVWQEGRQRASEALKEYANIDVLRPYFDVEPTEVRQRLIHSLIPEKFDQQSVKLPHELYGPTMVVLTLIAMLLFQMKTSGIAVPEGTLMGTAFGTCFGYWLGISGLLWMAAYGCNTSISMLQLLNLLGYALVGHCVVVFVTTVWHPSHSHVFFYVLWAAFGGLSSLKMASVLMSRTTGRAQKMIICVTVAGIHMLFLLYLHFAYHHVVEDLSSVFNEEKARVVQDTATQKLMSGSMVEKKEEVLKSVQNQMTTLGEDAAKLVTRSARKLSKHAGKLMGGLSANQTMTSQ